MALAFEIADALIVVPNAEDPVLPARHEMLALGGDVQRAELTLRPLNRPDDLPIEFLPVGNFAV